MEEILEARAFCAAKRRLDMEKDGKRIAAMMLEDPLIVTIREIEAEEHRREIEDDARDGE